MKFAIWLAGREPYIISSSGSQAPCMPQAPRGYLSYHREKTYLRIKTYRKKQSQEVEETKIELLVPAMTEDSDLWDSWIQGNRSVYI